MKSRFGFVLLLTVGAASLLGGWFGDRVSASSSGDETDQLIRTFTETLALVQANYSRDLSAEELVESAIRGMLRTLDPHSSFFATTDYSRLQEEQKGKYFGLGITIRGETPGSGRVVVVEPPAPGTPAYRVGLQAGDVISRINGEDIEDWDINEQVIPNLKGPKGTTVDIGVKRSGEPALLDFTVERDEIPLYTIKFAFRVEPGIGYIRIDRFSEVTERELDQALEDIDESSLEGLVLDLRDNPGGALGAAIAVSDRFLDKGELVVSTRGRDGEGNRPYRTRRSSRHEYPMVVLINRNSASASEIVAGALQDHDRALIIGETSFGKALVQTIYPLDGGKRGLALTTGKYYTPSDRLIQRDYSDGFYNYFYGRNRESANAKPSKEHNTDAGRPVFSGGGIRPDEEVELDKVDRLVREVIRRNLFFKFASKLTAGEIESDVRFQYSREETADLSEKEREPLVNRLVITDKTAELFKGFLREHERPIRFTDESFEENLELIKNRIRQQLLLSMFGEQEWYRVALQVDKQVQRAIELLPKAQALAQLTGTVEQ